MEKPKLALYWCSGCGGCEESVIDIGLDILKVIELVDIVFWPVAMDTKYSDIEAMDDGAIAVSLINGSIRMDEQEHMARLLRKKSKIIIAHGTCACYGGIAGLANFFSREECLDRVFKEVPGINNPHEIVPGTGSDLDGSKLELTRFNDIVKPLDQVIDVDYYIPGCPPEPKYILESIMSILEGRLQKKGWVYAERRALCAECSRRETKPETAHIHEIKRLHEWEWDKNKCFLAQDMICLGPSTRGGCLERCIRANMPCRGCYGPTGNVKDMGGKFLSAFASIIETNDEKELERMAESMIDMGGLFYRYTLPSSIIKKKMK